MWSLWPVQDFEEDVSVWECMSHVWSKDERNQRSISQRTKGDKVIIGCANEAGGGFLQSCYFLNSRGLVLHLGGMGVEPGGI